MECGVWSVECGVKKQWSRVSLATVNETCLINVFAPRRSRSLSPRLFAARQSSGFWYFGTIVSW